MDTTNLIGKFLLMYSQGVDLHHATAMKIDRAEEISGKLFVIGTQPDDLLGKDNWLGKMETFIAWDAVTQFHVFDDYESFEAICSDRKGGGLMSLFRS